MSRPDTQQVLEQAHRLMARSTGTVSLAATCRRLRASSLLACAADLRQATDLIESLLPRSPERPGEDW